MTSRENEMLAKPCHDVGLKLQKERHPINSEILTVMEHHSPNVRQRDLEQTLPRFFKVLVKTYLMSRGHIFTIELSYKK